MFRRDSACLHPSGPQPARAVSVASCAPVERSPSTLAPRLRAMAAASARLPPLRCSRGLQAASARPLRLQARAARPDPSLALFQALGGAILKSGVEVASSALASAQKGAAEEARAAAAPRKPPGPQLDVSPQLIADPLTFIDDAQREHGDVVGLRLAGERCVLVQSRRPRGGEASPQSRLAAPLVALTPRSPLSAPQLHAHRRPLGGAASANRAFGYRLRQGGHRLLPGLEPGWRGAAGERWRAVAAAEAA